MADGLAHQEEIRDEMLNGKVVLMFPRATVNHNRAPLNIARIFANRLDGKPCEDFSDGTDVYLTEKDRVIPDVMIICKRDNQVQGRFRRAGLDCRSIVPWNKETG